MKTLLQQQHEHNLAATRKALSDPRCFTCKQPATYSSDGITPGGDFALFCDLHVPKQPERLRGSDPGWAVSYVPITEAHESMNRWIAILLEASV